MDLKELQNKKVVIVGMGTNNKNLAKYMKKQGINFDVIDGWKSADELVGKLDKYDFVFRTPGLPYLSLAIQQAKEKGVRVLSQTKLFFELCKAPIIGITGTKGKGTTSSLIAKILQAGELKVWLGGNIGKDPLEFLEQVGTQDLVVLELSSFQLQDMEQSPHVAVVLNITPDHLDHHKTIEEYVEAKSNIVRFQKEQDFAVLHPDLPARFKKLGKGKKIFFTPTTTSGFQSKLQGFHNLENIAATVEVAKIFGIPEEVIRKTIAEFEPLPHRLQKITEKNGIIFINDSLSTNEDTAIAAIKSFENPIVLILGGQGKKTGYKRVAKAILHNPNVKAIVAVGVDSPEILNEIKGFKGKILTGAKNMAEIVAQARSLAKAGDVVLLSPAATSFDMFKNASDRGDQFAKAVNQ